MTRIDGCASCGTYNTDCPDCRAKHGFATKLVNCAIAFVVAFAITVTACGLFNQKPVCPENKPNCSMDHDPVIYQPHGAPGGMDVGVDVVDGVDAGNRG